MASTDLNEELLDARLRALEQRIIGGAKEAEDQQNIIDGLLAVKNKLQAVTAGRERYSTVNRKVEEIDEYISDPMLIEEKATRDGAKVDILLAQENRVLKVSSMLETIGNLEKVLDSPALRDCEELKPKLNALRSTILKSNERAKVINDETKKLLNMYANLLFVIKCHLISWDKKLSELETRKKVVKEFD